MAAQPPSLWEYTLVVLNEGAPQGEFRLNGSVLALGRDEDNDVCLSWDQHVSRHHARLRLEGANWVLEDLGSTNGTYVGQYRLGDPVIIVPGHTLRVGRTLLQLRAQQVAARVPPEELPAVVGSAPPPPAPPSQPSQPAKAVEVSQPVEPVGPSQPAEAGAPIQPSEPARPGIFRRALSSLGLVGSVPQAPEHVAEAEEPQALHQAEPSGPPHSPIGHVSCTIFPLAVEIRARRPSGDGPGVAQDLRAALNGLESSEHAVAKIVEPLHNGDAWVSVSASSGHEADLLALAGQVLDRLLHAGIHGTLSASSGD